MSNNLFKSFTVLLWIIPLGCGTWEYATSCEWTHLAAPILPNYDHQFSGVQSERHIFQYRRIFSRVLERNIPTNIRIRQGPSSTYLPSTWNPSNGPEFDLHASRDRNIRCWIRDISIFKNILDLQCLIQCHNRLSVSGRTSRIVQESLNAITEGCYSSGQ
jgi:hypothetical protein